LRRGEAWGAGIDGAGIDGAGITTAVSLGDLTAAPARAPRRGDSAPYSAPGYR
jgi:hypothetical protein